MGTVVASLLALEVLLRLLLFPCGMPEPATAGLPPPDYEMNYGSGRGDLSPNQNGIWTIWPHRPYHVQTNTDGLRNAEEVDPRAIHVLAIGDSFTFGPYVANEDTWPAWLEGMLNRQGRRRRVQVLNAGYAGYTIQDEYFYLEDRGLALDPQLVIIAFYANDIADFKGRQREYLSRSPRLTPSGSAWNGFTRGVRPLIRRSAIAQTLFRVFRWMRVRQAARAAASPSGTAAAKEAVLPTRDDDTANRQLYRDWFMRTISLLKGRHIPVLVVALPNLDQLAAPAMDTRPEHPLQDLTREMNVPFLDLLPALRSRAQVEDLYLVHFDPDQPPGQQYVGNGHMTSYGYRAVADLIAQRLKSASLEGPFSH